MTTENDTPKNKQIAALVVLVCITVFSVIIGVNEYYDGALRTELEHKVNAENNGLLKKLRSEEQTKLSTYQWVDKPKNIVRIPLDRAKELTLAAYAAPAPAAPVAPASPVVAPTPDKAAEKN